MTVPQQTITESSALPVPGGPQPDAHRRDAADVVARSQWFRHVA